MLLNAEVTTLCCTNMLRRTAKVQHWYVSSGIFGLGRWMGRAKPLSLTHMYERLGSSPFQLLPAAAPPAASRQSLPGVPCYTLRATRRTSGDPETSVPSDIPILHLLLRGNIIQY